MTELNLSAIEKALLDKETEKLNKELALHINAIFECVCNAIGYKIEPRNHLDCHKEDLNELNTWLNELKFLTTYYYGGDNLTSKQIQLPDFIKQKILAKVTKEFIDKVQEIQDIIL